MNQDICLKFSAFVHHMFLCKFDKKNLAIAQSACQPRPISAKTLDASSDRICWDILKRKKLVRFWTYMSHLMEEIFNSFKKMAFFIFLLSQGVHLQDVHGLWVMHKLRWPIFSFLKATKNGHFPVKTYHFFFPNFISVISYNLGLIQAYMTY